MDKLLGFGEALFGKETLERKLQETGKSGFES